MTQQFKFGDHVRYKDNENPVFGVVLEEANPRNGLITVQFIDGAEPELVGSDDLECIPPPRHRAAGLDRKATRLPVSQRPRRYKARYRSG